MTHGADEREVFLKALETTSFIGTACRKAGISRASVYRWMNEDLDFRLAVKQAVKRGHDILGEAAYSILQSKVKEKDWGAAKFALTHYPSMYGAKPRDINLKKEAKAEAEEDYENLSPEEKKRVTHQQFVKAFTGPDGTIQISKQMLERIRRDKNSGNHSEPPNPTPEDPTD